MDILTIVFWSILILAKVNLPRNIITKRAEVSQVDKAFLEKLEASEEARLHEAFQDSSKKDSSITTFFKSDDVRKTLEKGSQAFICGFNEELLPSIIPFSDRVLVEVCPKCKCVKRPDLLKPYLERQLVIPVLGDSYTNYPPEFVESIQGYPYVSYPEFYDIRSFAIRRGLAQLLSEAEVEGIRNACDQLMKHLPSNYIERSQDAVDTVFCNLQPYLSSDLHPLLNLVESLKKKDLNDVDRIFHISHIVSAFRSGQVFSLIPQMRIRQLNYLDLTPLEFGELASEVPDVKASIMSGLRISYDTSIPLETYLDIICERKSAIRGIVEKIIIAAKPEKETFLSDLRVEIEKINQEVEKITSSRKRIVFDFLTNFAVQNKGSIVAGLITAAGLGTMGLGLVGCGAGLVSGIATKAISKKADISIPKEASAIGKQLYKYIEPNYEELMAKTLSSNVQAIQLWHIKKRLSRQ